MENVSKTRHLLNPLDRASEILFGLIMALTFTCTIGIAKSDKTELKELLIAAISCNLAWGLVDAIMYLIGQLAERGRSRSILDSLRTVSDPGKARDQISGALPPVIASVIRNDELEQIRDRLNRLPAVEGGSWLTFHDLKNAFSVFLLVFISTFPVVIPFIFVHDTKVALRISNLAAIVMMFFCGWSLAKYVGYNKWILSSGMVVFGVILVLITIVLGG